jgi:hypothetical protein
MHFEWHATSFGGKKMSFRHVFESVDTFFSS